MEWPILMVCFFGAVVQVTTGLGFGLIVAPMLLAFYKPVDAIQITGILTLAIVATITPFLMQSVMSRKLIQLAVGTLVGLAIGSGLLLMAPMNSVRIAALIVLAYCLVRYLHSKAQSAYPENPDSEKNARQSVGLAYGIASGVMSATLAMPGPLVLLFLRGIGIDPKRVRATAFALMVGSYSGMLIISVALSGFSDAVVNAIKLYLLPTFAGLLIGQLLSSRLPDFLFDVMTTLLMFSTLLVLGLQIVNLSI